MDKSFIIRIYKQDNEIISGIVEDVDRNVREKFRNSKQLWSLITHDSKSQSKTRVLEANVINIAKAKT